jgi:DhnA family fructose-bisphosphate aldolase class Ia
MNNETRQRLLETRFTRPQAIADAAKTRRSHEPTSNEDRILIIAADHTARGMLDVGSNPSAMSNRYDLLDRLVAALAIPGVSGVLGTPDIIEDLLLLDALEQKYVFGSMNRGGLPGAVFEMDDRFTAYTAESIVRDKLDGGKMLLRINLDDPGTANVLESSANAVSQLAANDKIAMIEPFMSSRIEGRIQHDLSADGVMRSMAIASALGATSSHTWLKVPVVDDMERVAEATTMPIMLLGGPRSDRPDEMFDRWEKTLRLPGVRGLVVGRNLLYPSDDDVSTAVKTAVSLL